MSLRWFVLCLAVQGSIGVPTAGAIDPIYSESEWEQLWREHLTTHPMVETAGAQIGPGLTKLKVTESAADFSWYWTEFNKRVPRNSNVFSDSSTILNPGSVLDGYDAVESRLQGMCSAAHPWRLLFRL